MFNNISMIVISIMQMLLSFLLAVTAIMVITLIWCVVFADDWRAKWIRYRYQKLYEKIARLTSLLRKEESS